MRLPPLYDSHHSIVIFEKVIAECSNHTEANVHTGSHQYRFVQLFYIQTELLFLIPKFEPTKRTSEKEWISTDNHRSILLTVNAPHFYSIQKCVENHTKNGIKIYCKLWFFFFFRQQIKIIILWRQSIWDCARELEICRVFFFSLFISLKKTNQSTNTEIYKK